MLLMLDNYDSFTYILVQYFRKLGVEMPVYRNDSIALEEIEALKPEGIVISPGPGNPDNAGLSLSAIRHFAGSIPILGVCLGHQSIGQVFGGKVVRAPRLMHGKTSLIHHEGKGLFAQMSQPFTATRYHSLILEPGSLPSCLAVTAWTDQDEIMGIRHRSLPIEGVQFHPESILTKDGIKLLKNFIDDNQITVLKGAVKQCSH